MTTAPVLTPPHDLDAEATVISSILIDPRCLTDVADTLRAGDFYADSNRRIFEAITALDAGGSRIDVVSVASRLRETERLAQVGGSPYLAQLLGMVPAVAHVEDHARTVAQLSYQRRLLGELKIATAEGYHAPDPLTWGQSVEQRIFAAAQWDRRGSEDGTLDVVVPEAIEALTARANGTAAASGRVIRTGISALDRKLGGGFRCGNKYELAGRPGMGKSALGLQFVASCAQQGEAGIVVSVEMPKDQIALRLLSQESGVLHARLERCAMRSDDWERLMAHAQRVQRLPMSIVYAPAATSSQVRTVVRREMARLRRIHGEALRLGMVAIDHVHIMNGERQRGENEQGELTRLSKSNLWIAGEFDCVVLELAQLNRGLENRPDKRPNLSDLRGSGSIEEDAHTVLFPFRPAYYDKDRTVEPMQDNATPEDCEIMVAKQRGGVTGAVPCLFHGQTLRFIGVADGFDDAAEDGDARYGS